MNEIFVNCLFVGAGGAIGAVARYLLSYAPWHFVGAFPMGTMIVNIIGALLMGIVVGVAATSFSLDAHIMTFLRVGVCGGFTTFSTFALESAQLLQSGNIVITGAYIILSVSLCIIAILAGEYAVESLVKA